jgi:hypothetical protein
MNFLETTHYLDMIQNLNNNCHRSYLKKNMLSKWNTSFYFNTLINIIFILNILQKHYLKSGEYVAEKSEDRLYPLPAEST